MEWREKSRVVEGRCVTEVEAVAARPLRTQLHRVIRLTGHLLPGMRERKWGRVITVSSSGVVEPVPVLGISNTLRVALLGSPFVRADDFSFVAHLFVSAAPRRAGESMRAYTECDEGNGGWDAQCIEVHPMGGEASGYLARSVTNRAANSCRSHAASSSNFCTSSE